jgi:hypothetical protein
MSNPASQNAAMKPEWLPYAEQIRKEIDNMRAKKSGKNVERRLFSTWSEACTTKSYKGSFHFCVPYAQKCVGRPNLRRRLSSNAAVHVHANAVVEGSGVTAMP